MVNESWGEPIYQQIVGQIRRLIAAGVLAPGMALPSVRQMACKFGVNPMTVSKAYSALEAAGMVVRERGKGMIVSHDGAGKRDAPARLTMLRETVARAAFEAKQLGLPEADAVLLFDEEMKKLARGGGRPKDRGASDSNSN